MKVQLNQYPDGLHICANEDNGDFAADYGPITTKKALSRLAALCPDGIPKYVRIYDNGGTEQEGGTLDRYTCVFTGHYTGRTNGSHWDICFNGAPFHPQGIGMHGESDKPIDVRPGSWGGPSIGKKCHLGTRIRFEDLPRDGKLFVMQEYLYLWDFIKD